jgi:short-subunit dehydrogenase
MTLEHKAILITGASRGLGAALSRRLAEKRARLCLVARNPAPLAELVAELRGRGTEAHALFYDVGD